MLVKRVMSWSRICTLVSPAGTSHCVLVLSVSTCAVKYPPWQRSLEPSFMLSSTTWFAPKGIHSPIIIVTLLIVMISSRSSRMVLSFVADSEALCALDDITGPPGLRSVLGRYGLETYDTSSVSVTVDSLVTVSLRSMNLSSSNTTCRICPSVMTRSSTAWRSSSGRRFAMSCRPLGEIWYAVMLWCSLVLSLRPFTSLPSTRSSRSSLPSWLMLR
mmetsp:Transcript_11013/g.38240  ORF Transcript_11013/g.38240 Transcript_11013/m.38240 type:complete len:216 (+) Transcript_11013:2015-2662(+)